VSFVGINGFSAAPRRVSRRNRIVAEKTMATNPVRPDNSGEVASSPATSRPLPSIGADESGKGDYFGPTGKRGGVRGHGLRRSLDADRRVGLQASERASDRRVRELAPQHPRRWKGTATSSRRLTPERYNALYASFSAQGRNLKCWRGRTRARSRTYC
jgi:ribonuclease HIII